MRLVKNECCDLERTERHACFADSAMIYIVEYCMTYNLKLFCLHLTAFMETSSNPMFQLHHPEDMFIDQMAMGKLLLRDSEGFVRAGSLEGIVAEVIKVSWVI